MADFEVGSLTPEQTRLLWQDYQQRRQLQPQLQQNLPVRRVIDDPPAHRVFVKNESSEAIPAYACMQVAGTVTEVGRVFLRVTKPDSTCGEYVFNSPYQIDAGGYGWAYAWGVVKMLGTAGLYTACKRYKPSVGSWSVSEGPGPFLVYGNDDEMSGVVIGRIVGEKCKAKWIKFLYNSNSASPVTVDAFYDGPDPSLCGSVDVEYPLGEPCKDDVDVIAFYDSNTDTYQAIATESAMLGTPETKTLINADITIADTCLLTYNKQSYKTFPCKSEPQLHQVSIGTSAVDVVSAVYDDGTKIVIDYVTVYVCGFGGTHSGNIPTEICVDPVECTGNCTWTWRHTSTVGDGGFWELTTPCAYGCNCGEVPLPPVDGTDPASDGRTAVASCVANSP